ncbi:hypothetical protein OO013_07895 [Mangrovivirga sp. M17]|uniref:Lipoprotein n=1 Tax=Mangrovivirga halotolerans TaxID=2993936 RepID=A0ABT3RR86_9BACT|nr:hypothetical protein [Mangrovivirga halotolerans]MCX2743782.1 hypothetical protein [Mangrovivirga halotolerans]
MKFFSFLALIVICASCRMFRDTEGYDIKSKHNDDNVVFTTNSKFIYSIDRIKGSDTLGNYIVNHLNDTLVVDRVMLTVLPGSFLGQTKVKWEYLNPNDSVVQKNITGIIEDSTTVWIHPPRSGMPLIFTESAPFPKVKFPLVDNLSWPDGIGNLKGYEEIGLTGSVSFTYKNLGQAGVKTTNKNYKKSWKFFSEGQSCIGLSIHIFHFDEVDGFVYSEYDFPNGEKVILQLEKRIEPM